MIRRHSASSSKLFQLAKALFLECSRSTPACPIPCTRLLAQHVPAMLLAHFVGDASSRQTHELGERRVRPARATGQRGNEAGHGCVAVTVKRAQINGAGAVLELLMSRAVWIAPIATTATSARTITAVIATLTRTRINRLAVRPGRA